MSNIKEITFNGMKIREITLAPNHYITLDGRIFKELQTTMEIKEVETGMYRQEELLWRQSPMLKCRIDGVAKTIRRPIETYLGMAWLPNPNNYQRAILIDGDKHNLNLENIRLMDTVKNELLESGLRIKKIDGAQNAIIVENGKVYRMISSLPNVADPLPLLSNGEIDFDKALDFAEVKSSVNAGGYLRTCVTGDKIVITKIGRKTHNMLSPLIHRLVAEAFIPNPENKPEVNHKDSNKLNLSLDNLEWATPDENITHAYDSNTSYTKKRTSKEQDEEIIHAIMDGATNKEIADKYGMNDRTVREIRTRKARPAVWKRLYPDAEVMPNPVTNKKRDITIAIMKDLYAGLTNNEIAKKHGVSPSAVLKTRNGINNVELHKEVFNSEPFPK